MHQLVYKKIKLVSKFLKFHLFLGYIMAIPAFTYAIAASFVGVLFKGVPRRYLTQIAFIVSTVALFLFGPS